MQTERMESIDVDKVASAAKEAAASILKGRMDNWNATSVEIGLFPDGGIVGGRIHCRDLDRLHAGELVKVAGEINANLSRNFRDLNVEVQLVDRIITMGGKLGPDVIFDQFGR